MKYKIINYPFIITTEQLQELCLMKTNDRDLKTLLRINIIYINLDIKAIIKIFFEYGFDGFVFTSMKSLSDVTNMGLVISYLSRMPEPYNNIKWEFYTDILEPSVQKYIKYTKVHGIVNEKDQVILANGTTDISSINNVMYPSSTVFKNINSNTINDIINSYM